MEIPMAADVEGFEVIKTGLPQLDRIIGGGVPFKKITEIHGQQTLGKTTLALHVVSQAQLAGKKTVWVDAEWAWDALFNEYAKGIGVDPTKLGLLQSQYAEESLDKLIDYCEKEKDSVIVIDAIGGIHTKDEAQKYSGERTIGSQSALVARFCRKIVPLLDMNNHALVVLNHEFMPIAQMGRVSAQPSGGAKLAYHKSLSIRLKKAGENIKSGDEKVGKVIIAEVKKSKVSGTEGATCELELIFGRGFNAASDWVEDAKASGELEKKGQFYWFRGEKVARGENGLREWAASFAEKL